MGIGSKAQHQTDAKYVDRPIRQIIIWTDDLKRFGKKERALLLMLGHASNELAALYRAACAAGKEARVDADIVTRQVARAQTLLMLRLALSKVHEVIEKTGKGRYQEILAEVGSEFAAAEQKAIDDIGKHMPLRDIRNHFGFHYDSKVIGSLGTERLGKEKSETHDFIVSRKSVNTFFALSENFYQKAFANAMMTRCSFEEFVGDQILRFVEDALNVVDKFTTALHCAIIALCKSIGIDPDDEKRWHDSMAPYTRIEDARLPAFIAFKDEQ